MNINKSEVLSKSLSQLTYNGSSMQIPPPNNKLNIYMGIGLWSVTHGLSTGLPVDVIHMLLSATVLRAQIGEAAPRMSSKVIILIADSMAAEEGAKLGVEKHQIAQLVAIYKRSLMPLLDLLDMQDSSEIVLSSDLVEIKEYQETLLSVEQNPVLQKLSEDKTHYAYMRTQTAITQYMHTHRGVGVKIGWIYKDSIKQLAKDDVESEYKPHWEWLKEVPENKQHWDELKFDPKIKAISQNSTMQYLYAKAGQKQLLDGAHKKGKRQIVVKEGCPYTAYENDQRYVIQVQHKKRIQDICAIQREVRGRWRVIAEVCFNLMELEIVRKAILPEDCLQEVSNPIRCKKLKLNNDSPLYCMLNHWLHSSEADRKNNS